MSKILALAVLLPMLVVCPLSAQQIALPEWPRADAPPPSWLRTLGTDARVITSAPLRWSPQTWRNVAIGTGVVAAVMLIDDQTRLTVATNSDGSRARAADFLEPFGAEYSWVLLGSFYGAGRAFGNQRAMVVAKDGLTSSLIAAGMITPLLKLSFGRARPSDEIRGPDFRSGGSSFPSGHTTQAFAIASVIAAHYDSYWVDVIAYGIATGVGWSRMQHDAHYLSDVLVGAAIGITVGKMVVRLNNQRRLGIEPFATRGGGGLAVRFDASSVGRWITRRRPLQ